MELLTLRILFKIGQDRITSILLSLAFMPWFEMMSPKKVTSSVKNMQFLDYQTASYDLKPSYHESNGLDALVLTYCR